MNEMNFSETIDFIQEKMNMSMTELAFKCNISYGYLAGLKKGRYRATLQVYKSIYDFLPEEFKKMIEKFEPIKNTKLKTRPGRKTASEIRQRVLEDVVFNVFKLSKSDVLKLSEILDNALMRNVN